MSHIQVKEGHYLRPEYVSLARFISYYYQIDTIRRARPSKLLLVGVGDGIVPFFLRHARFEITTLDFDASLKPDVVGDIRALPFKDGEFDVAGAFEVLEHMPFEESERALAELARVTRRNVLISVPHRRTGFEFVIRFPYIHTILGRDFLRFALRVPVRFPQGISKQHFWEIDGYTTSLSAFRRAL